MNIQRAVQLLQQDRITDALVLLKKLHAANKDDPEVLFRLGVAYLKLRNYAAGEACCRKTLVLQPDHIQAANHLGNALVWQGRNEDALDVFHKVLAIAPDNARAAGGIAGIYEIMGEYQKAYDQVCPFVERGIVNAGVALALGRVCRHIDYAEGAIRYMSARCTTSIDQWP